MRKARDEDTAWATPVVAEVIRNADKLEILATSKLDDRFDASPALAGNDIFLKGRKNLYCISSR
jgi:outer membrane protein assembly factor BamB